MSSKKYAAPLQLEIRRSKSLLYFLCLLHVIAIGVIFFLVMSIEIILLLTLFILYSAYYSITRYALLSAPDAVVTVIWDHNDKWKIRTRRSREQVVKLMWDSFTHPNLTVLNFKRQGQFFSQSVILLADNVNKEDFRRLRVRLKTTNHQQAQSVDS